MKTLSITAEGHTQNDIELALMEAKRLVEMGFQSGADSNDTGSFSFSVTGEEEEPAADDAS